VVGFTTHERPSVTDSGAYVIAFRNAGYSTWDKLRCVVTHWDVIDELLDQEGPRAALLLLSKATVVAL